VLAVAGPVMVGAVVCGVLGAADLGSATAV
jgi:hypothetical protein